MTRDEARQVLLLYRPWAADPDDTEMMEALALVQSDSELRVWFETHCEQQHALRNCLRAQTPPDAFREQIISECLARRRYVSRRTLLATATAVLLAVVGFQAWYYFAEHEGEEEINYAAFERRMSRDALRLYRMDLETNDLNIIQEFLAGEQSPADYQLPDALRAVKATGCLATKWQGRAVSMICFHTGKPLPPGRSSDLFLFVIDQNQLPDAPADSTPTFGQINRLTVARWSEGGKTYLLAGEHGEEELRKNL